MLRGVLRGDGGKPSSDMSFRYPDDCCVEGGAPTTSFGITASSFFTTRGAVASDADFATSIPREDFGGGEDSATVGPLITVTDFGSSISTREGFISSEAAMTF
eukprot:CAMPEP_0184354812 /NCGR_PEP_ID=MMETSP1089-20130417/91262_1 /TAXON_ID=38269 ORGANISM="Gloeochaete wittrockiana, Strain SAG46.84" /NCGR_SAMPLE_ID=MMETSP1089 /ASSEMBLY_ACC=CAM_ASM_000445 /LENGTH=102 /DNA_ID=CAMNT_0026691063 /DNA_START=591 /DNA_END=899 /DNA_ORIENTATION=+